MQRIAPRRDCPCSGNSFQIRRIFWAIPRKLLPAIACREGRLTKRTTIHCSYFLFVSARARGAARFEEPGPRGRTHMSSPAGSTRSNINSMTGALAPRTRSGATYGSGAAAPSTPVRGPALRLVDPEDAALRRASADVPSFLEQAEGTVPQGALQLSAGLLRRRRSLSQISHFSFARAESALHKCALVTRSVQSDSASCTCA